MPDDPFSLNYSYRLAIAQGHLVVNPRRRAAVITQGAPVPVRLDYARALRFVERLLDAPERDPLLSRITMQSKRRQASAVKLWRERQQRRAA